MKNKIHFWFLLPAIILTSLFVLLFLKYDINIFVDTLTSMGFFDWNMFLHDILAICVGIAMILYVYTWGLIWKRLRKYLLSIYSFSIIIVIIVFAITLEPVLEWIIVFMGLVELYCNAFFF